MRNANVFRFYANNDQRYVASFELQMMNYFPRQIQSTHWRNATTKHVIEEKDEENRFLNFLSKKTVFFKFF